MQYKVDKILEGYGIVSHAKVLVALSGGVDSMVLLMMLKNSSLKLDLYAAHVNFHLRGAESDGDSCFVNDWCKSHNITLFTNDVDTISYAKDHKVSVEVAARDLRYNWFYNLMKANDINLLAVAHNANDNAETLMLNLLRGCGIEGCTAIKENRIVHDNFRIIRPIISFTRKEIEHCARNLSIPYRTDSTNTDTKYSRNRIRHDVIPVFEQINPSAVKSLNKSIAYLTSAGNILNKLFNEKFSLIAGDALETLSAQNIKHYPASKFLKAAFYVDKLLAESEYELFLHHYLSGYGFSASQEEQLSVLLKENRSAEFSSESYILQKERNFIKIYDKIVGNMINPINLHVKDTASVNFGELSLNFRVVDNHYSTPDSFTLECSNISNFKQLAVDYDKVGDIIHISSLCTGDRIIPFGMTGVKKVADVLSDAKVDLQNKHLIPLLKDNSNNIFAICGVMIDDRVRVGRGTERVLLISFA